MAYSIELKKSVEKDIRKIPKKEIRRIVEAMEGLAKEPRSSGSMKIKATERTYRIRVGDYRVIYQIDDEEKTVLVTHIRHRKDAYRNIGP